MDDSTERDPNDKVSKVGLYEAYCDYCTLELMDPCGKRDFGIAIKNKGFQPVKSNGAWHWKGLRLKQQPLIGSVANTATATGNGLIFE